MMIIIITFCNYYCYSYSLLLINVSCFITLIIVIIIGTVVVIDHIAHHYHRYGADINEDIIDDSNQDGPHDSTYDLEDPGCVGHRHMTIRMLSDICAFQGLV